MGGNVNCLSILSSRHFLLRNFNMNSIVSYQDMILFNNVGNSVKYSFQSSKSLGVYFSYCSRHVSGVSRESTSGMCRSQVRVPESTLYFLLVPFTLYCMSVLSYSVSSAPKTSCLYTNVIEIKI